MPLPRTD